MDLSTRPDLCIFEILKQTNLQSFIRARKTCKRLDQFVEKRRNILNVICPNNRPIWLRIRFNYEKGFPHFQIFHDDVQENFHSDPGIDDDSFKTVEDPYRELSGMKFNGIILDTLTYANEDALNDDGACDSLVTELGRLCLSCEWIYCCTEKSVKLLSLISFEKFGMAQEVTIEQFEKWPLKNCRGIFITLPKIPSEVPSLFRGFSYVHVDFFFCNYAGFVVFINLFITEWKMNKTLKGKLEKLQISGFGITIDIEEDLGLIPFWRTESNGKASLSKVNVDCGIAYILVKMRMVYLIFSKTNRDDEVITKFKTDYLLTD